MDINERIKKEFEERLKKVEDFIEEKGFGSSQLTKAKKVQRNVNLAVFLGGLITVAGITFWVLSGEEE